MRSNKFNNSKFDHQLSLHTRINGNVCSQANLVLSILPLPPPPKGVGLCNITGVDCFINSTIQCLMHVQPFANFLEHNLRCLCSGFCGLKELSILRRCALRSRYTIRNRDLHRNIKAIDPFADAYRQNDAFLFLCGFISNQIERCCNSLQATAIFFEKVFKTTWRNEVICTSCSHKSITYKQEQAIQVGLGKMLIGSIRDWAGPYPLNDYKCDKCSKNTCTQKCNLTHLPEILIIQVKRFRYDRYLQRSVKINSYMSYNETLDMSEFCEHPEEDARYKLSASIVHVGNTPRSGHYYAYAKTASGWVKFNDNMTSNVVLETTLRDKPYILFYTKENTSSTASIASSSSSSSSPSPVLSNNDSQNLKFISSNPDTETNTLSCNIIKHVTEKQSDVSLNDKVPISIQSSVVESMNSINTDMVIDSCNNKDQNENMDTIETKISFNENQNEQATSHDSNSLINNNNNEFNDDTGSEKSNTSVFEYGQCRWVVESVPSLNSLNNNWKEKFSQVRNKTIRKRRKGKLRGRVNLQDVEKES